MGGVAGQQGPLSSERRQHRLVRRLSAVHRRHLGLFAEVRFAFLGFVTVVLEPDLHLGGRQADHVRQLVSLWCRQVLLKFEAVLKLVDLNLSTFHPSIHYYMYYYYYYLRHHTQPKGLRMHGVVSVLLPNVVA